MTLSQPVLVAVAIFVAYTAIVAVMWRVTGTRYDHLADTREHAAKGIVLSIGVGAAFLVTATTVLGWWPDALFEGERSGPAWAWVVPALMAVVALITTVTIDLRAAGARVLPVLFIGTLLVGFAEELVSRGILVVGLRQGGANEWAVWLVTAVLFALLHAINALFGQSVKLTVTQMVAAFFAGTAFYVTLMVTGTLLVGMALHALWDFGTLGVEATGRTQKPVAGLLGLLMFAVSLVAVVFVILA